MLVSLQCQQLDLLTLITSMIDEQSVTLLACIQCPIRLEIDDLDWSWLRAVPLFTLLAGLPNLIALSITSFSEPSNVRRMSGILWYQRGAILPHVRWLEVEGIRLSDSLSTLQSILGMCPALKHLYLHSASKLPLADRLAVQEHFWHAFQLCAKLVLLKIDCMPACLVGAITF